MARELRIKVIVPIPMDAAGVGGMRLWPTPVDGRNLLGRPANRP